ncbi:MAG: putative phage abortive infection protein [Methylococcaceae bacterium]
MKKIENCIINNAVLIALLMVVVVIFSYVLNFHSQFISGDADKWGVFGDFIGGTLNPFLSFLALIILLRTFSMQRNELKDTQRILQTQNAMRIKQNFESTFFSLLNVHNQILAEFSVLPVQYNTKFDGIAKDVEEIWQRYNNKSALRKTLYDANYDSHEFPHTKITSLDTAYKNLMVDVIYYGNYFHILRELLRFIKMNAPLEYEFSYSRITKSMLTNDVLQLLAIYCYKDDEYRLLLERYAIFENASFNPKSVDNDEFPAVLEAVQFYDSKIFGL